MHDKTYIGSFPLVTQVDTNVILLFLVLNE